MASQEEADRRRGEAVREREEANRERERLEHEGSILAEKLELVAASLRYRSNYGIAYDDERIVVRDRRREIVKELRLPSFDEVRQVLDGYMTLRTKYDFYPGNAVSGI